MLVVETIARIRRAHFVQGKSIKAICRELRASTEAAHANLNRSAPSFADYLDALERQGLPQLTERLRA